MSQRCRACGAKDGPGKVDSEVDRCPACLLAAPPDPTPAPPPEDHSGTWDQMGDAIPLSDPESMTPEPPKGPPPCKRKRKPTRRRSAR